MKYILSLLITFILTFQSCFAQDSLAIDYNEPDFILKQPELKYDLSIESRVLRDAYYIVLDKNEVRFYTENMRLSERYDFTFKSISVSDETNFIRYNMEIGGPFRRMVISYKKTSHDNYSCTIKFFNITGKLVYSAHTNHLTDYEEISLEREYLGVK